jgi:inner membrane protein
MMMLAANAPDIDVVSWFGGTLSYLEHHRQYTHSLAFSPLIALIPWALVRFIGRAPLGLLEYGAALIGVLSHLLLDWTNVYGVRLFLPFSDKWMRLDMTDVVDPWILTILVLALGAPALVKLVSDEIGGKKLPPPKRAWASFAIIGLVAYEGVRFTSHERALGMLESHLYGDAPPERVTAVPDRLNPTHWRGVVEGDGFLYEVPVHVTEDFLARGGRIDYPPGASPAIDAARKTHPFQVFGKFDQLPFWRLIPVPDGLRVELLDLRFGSVLRPGFMAVAEVTPDGQVRDSRFTFGPIPPPGSVIQ